MAVHSAWIRMAAYTFPCGSVCNLLHFNAMHLGVSRFCHLSVSPGCDGVMAGGLVQC